MNVDITGGVIRLHVRIVSILAEVEMNIQEVNCVEVCVCLNPKFLLPEELNELFPQNISLPGSGRGHQKSIIAIQAYLVSRDQLIDEGQKV